MFFMHRAVDQMAAAKMSSLDYVSIKAADFLKCCIRAKKIKLKKKRKKKKTCVHTWHSSCALFLIVYCERTKIPAKVWTFGLVIEQSEK